MQIISIKDQAAYQENWTDFIKKNPGCFGVEFLLSLQWLNILKQEKKEVQLLAVVENEKWLANILLIKKTVYKNFFYWYAPRGPLLKNSLELDEVKKVIDFLFFSIFKIDRHALFLKIEPSNKVEEFWSSFLASKSLAGVFGIKEAADIQPKQTLTLDLKKDSADLLQEMHQKTRYNIRLAEKKGIKIVAGEAPDFAEFWRLMSLTGGRDNFRLHEEAHYRQLFSNNQPFIRIFFAEYNHKKIATAMICFFAGRATYLHGGSDNEFRNMMAPYLLQWEIIKLAQAEGLAIYDFYGVDEKKWPGVTRFKLGFGGQIKKSAGVFNIIFRPALYRCYLLVKKIINYVRRY